MRLIRSTRVRSYLSAQPSLRVANQFTLKIGEREHPTHVDTPQLLQRLIHSLVIPEMWTHLLGDL